MGTRPLEKVELELRRHVQSRFVRDDPPSPLPVALMVPIAPKDIDRARVSVPRMRSMIGHPIAKTVIVAPEDAGLRALAGELGAEFVDERGPLEALFPAGRLAELPGSIRQQFLKLRAPEITGTEAVVMMDADTYPLRPTAFTDPDGRSYVLQGDANAFSEKAARLTVALLGPLPCRVRSLISHTMLFRAEVLAALRARIEAVNDAPWQEAILTLHAPDAPLERRMAEWDIYGRFALSEMPDAHRLRYYAGIKAPLAQFMGEAPIPAWKHRFRFVSSHHHTLERPS